jgi:hypothetical protein
VPFRLHLQYEALTLRYRIANMSEEAGAGDQNGALMSDPVDVIIDKLLRYVNRR